MPDCERVSMKDRGAKMLQFAPVCTQMHPNAPVWSIQLEDAKRTHRVLGCTQATDSQRLPGDGAVDKRARQASPNKGGRTRRNYDGAKRSHRLNFARKCRLGSW